LGLAPIGGDSLSQRIRPASSSGVADLSRATVQRSSEAAEGLFNLVKALPPMFKYEPGKIRKRKGITPAEYQTRGLYAC